nr:hypothetical protein [Corynebacterium sp. UBA5992]
MQSDDDVLGLLDAQVVALDGGFNVGHVFGTEFAVGAFGVSAKA